MKAATADERERLFETGKLWCEAVGVEFVRHSTLGNLVERAQRHGVGHRESKSSKCLQDYADALFILDEVLTIMDPQESTTDFHARNIRKIASLTELIPVYGLCGFTATPIPARRWVVASGRALPDGTKLTGTCAPSPTLPRHSGCDE